MHDAYYDDVRVPAWQFEEPGLIPTLSDMWICRNPCHISLEFHSLCGSWG